MESMIGTTTNGEGVGRLMLEKLRKGWQQIGPVVIFLCTLVLCMVAVSVWVLYVGNPLVDYVEDMWIVRASLVVVALALVVGERLWRRSKQNRDL